MLNYCSKFAIAGVASLGLVAGASEAATIPPVLVDDFQGYDLGDLAGQGYWDYVDDPRADGNTQVQIKPGVAGDKVFASNEFSDIAFNNDPVFADHLPVGGSATVYFQLRVDSPSDMSFGFAQSDSPDWPFGEFATQAGVTGTILDEDGEEVRTNLRAHDGDGFQMLTEIELREWYELWFDIDNDNQLWSLRIRGGDDFEDENVAPTVLASDFGFRNTAESPIQSMLVHTRDGMAYIDNIYIPEPASLALLGVGGLMLLRRRR